MRRALYRVAASLDGYIAGPHGGVDWIVHDPEVDLAEVYESGSTADTACTRARAKGSNGLLGLRYRVSAAAL